MEYPNVSILMPSYNRRKFLPLIAHNLMNMDYDKKRPCDEFKHKFICDYLIDNSIDREQL